MTRSPPSTPVNMNLMHCVSHIINGDMPPAEGIEWMAGKGESVYLIHTWAQCMCLYMYSLQYKRSEY